MAGSAYCPTYDASSTICPLPQWKLNSRGTSRSPLRFALDVVFVMLGEARVTHSVAPRGRGAGAAATSALDHVVCAIHSGAGATPRVQPGYIHCRYAAGLVEPLLGIAVRALVLKIPGAAAETSRTVIAKRRPVCRSAEHEFGEYSV